MLNGGGQHARCLQCFMDGPSVHNSAYLLYHPWIRKISLGPLREYGRQACRHTSHMTIITRSNRSCHKQTIPVTAGLTRVEYMKILGVTFSSSFSFDNHIDVICSRARQAQYAFRVLASHGLRGQRLHDVVRSTLVAGLIYSSPSWWGFAGAADR